MLILLKRHRVNWSKLFEFFSDCVFIPVFRYKFDVQIISSVTLRLLIFEKLCHYLGALVWTVLYGLLSGVRIFELDVGKTLGLVKLVKSDFQADDNSKLLENGMQIPLFHVFRYTFHKNIGPQQLLLLLRLHNLLFKFECSAFLAINIEVSNFFADLFIFLLRLAIDFHESRHAVLLHIPLNLGWFLKSYTGLELHNLREFE